MGGDRHLGLKAPGSERFTVQSVERTLELFEILVNAGQDLGLHELCEASGLPGGTVHRLVGVLLNRGYVRQHPLTRRYGLGYAASDLAAKIDSQRSLVDDARPALQRLVELSGETASLAVLEGSHALYVDQALGPGRVRVFTEVGRRVPLHATAVGKVLLAFAPPRKRTALLEGAELSWFTPATISRREALERELDAVRERGYATDLAELDEDVHCLAGPVFDASGDVAASASVAAPRSRLPVERMEELAPKMLAVLADLSRSLGWPGPQA
jgi:IclR family acetate operon transcriptional repressor